MSARTTEEDGDKGLQLPEGLLARLRMAPSGALEHLALAAVHRWGTEAGDYAQGLRTEHPNATNRELAQIVKHRHALLARWQGATAGVPATFAPVLGTVLTILPNLAALAWIQSRMVVRIAAVYGRDTADKETAAELLLLQGIYQTTDAARLAITEAGKRVATRLVKRYMTGGALQLLKQLSRYVGIKFTRVGVLRAVPLISIPISAGVDELSTRSLANRAMKFYELGPRRDG